MDDKQIIAPEWATYLSDKDPITGEQWMKEIPTNCVFNKGVTGCGATTLAIKQPGNTILALPFVGLVENKAGINPEMLSLHGGIGSNPVERRRMIEAYITSHKTNKIATTYDLIPFVCDVLINMGIDPYQDYFLFVDEWHVLFNSYGYRDSVKPLLAKSKLFTRKTFISATPIPRAYWLKELSDLPEYKLIWPNALKININSYKVDSPLDYMARLCKSRLKYGGQDNYHIFINSVSGIARIIHLAGLSPESCRIVCSQSDGDRKKKNQEKLTTEYAIASTLDPIKPFNFYTSTCFEGQDIYDRDGRIFIVSEKYQDHTKMDITTSLLQICGRIRDSKYNTEINQYYATSPYKDLSFEEFRDSVYRALLNAENDAQKLNSILESLSKDGNDYIKSSASKHPYMTIENGKLVADYNAANVEIVNYGVVNGQYATQCNMNEALTAAGLVVNNIIQEHPDVVLENTPRSVARQPFKDVFEEYCSLREGSIVYDLTFRANQIEVEKPLVRDAFEKLGPKRVRELKYHQGNIKRELIKVANETLHTKMLLLLEKQLPKGVVIPGARIKQILQDDYKYLGSNHVAKAKEINDWYDVVETKPRGKDGKQIPSYTIIRAKEKVIFK